MTAHLARLLGTSDSRITPRRVPSALLVERRLAEPIVQTARALATLGELVGEAAATMEERQLGGRRFAARFFRSDGLAIDLAVETSLAVRDPAIVMRLFDERLDSLADPLNPGFAFDLIRLACRSSRRSRPRSHSYRGTPTTTSWPSSRSLASGSSAAGPAPAIPRRGSRPICRASAARRVACSSKKNSIYHNQVF